jgi:trk system potassium uptake protein TrkA
VSTLSPGNQVAVLGLGRFGGALASELVRLGYDVLGVDEDEARVQYYVRAVTHVVAADITEIEVLRQLGLSEMSHVVVAVGSDMEASILATAALEELGIPNIWAKAVTTSHGRILQRVGAHHVVYPEHDMGHQVAHLMGGRMIDWFQLDESFVMVETEVPEHMVGKTLADVGIRANYGVTVVCLKPEGGSFTYATADTELAAGDVLVVAGDTAAAEAFARMA